MGRVLRHHHLTALTAPEVLAAAMPAESNMLEFCSTVEGLRAEQHRIVEWLDGQVPGRGHDLLPAALAHVGFDIAGWYRRVLVGDKGKEGHLIEVPLHPDAS